MPARFDRAACANGHAWQALVREDGSAVHPGAAFCPACGEPADRADHAREDDVARLLAGLSVDEDLEESVDLADLASEFADLED